MLMTYMNTKRKKMNLEMMMLADCINIEGQVPKEMIDQIRKVGEILDVRAVAYKDL